MELGVKGGRSGARLVYAPHFIVVCTHAMLRKIPPSPLSTTTTQYAQPSPLLNLQGFREVTVENVGSVDSTGTETDVGKHLEVGP
jgi:hypothetical protein